MVKVRRLGGSKQTLCAEQLEHSATPGYLGDLKEW